MNQVNAAAGHSNYPVNPWSAVGRKPSGTPVQPNAPVPTSVGPHSFHGQHPQQSVSSQQQPQSLFSGPAGSGGGGGGGGVQPGAQKKPFFPRSLRVPNTQTPLSGGGVSQPKPPPSVGFLDHSQPEVAIPGLMATQASGTEPDGTRKGNPPLGGLEGEGEEEEDPNTRIAYEVDGDGKPIKVVSGDCPY